MSSKAPSDAVKIIVVAFLITGNLIGAGILALPVNTGLAGLIPSLVGMIAICGMMYFSAVVLAREANTSRQESFNYPSLYHQHLGSGGKWVAVLANLLILYGLLTAYLTGGSTIITQLFNIKSPLFSGVIMLLLFFVVTGVTVLGVGLIKKFNSLLMVLLWGSFFIIVFIAGRHVEVQRLAFHDWAFLPATVPIIVTSFHFHNIIPTVCADMKWDSRLVSRAMLLGMIIGFAMNAIWIFVGVGALPLTGTISLDAAYHANIPATVPLSQIIGSGAFVVFAMIFALIAIMTSYVANGLGLMGFIRDLTENFLGTRNPVIVIVLAFGPPLIVSYLFPDIFLKAMNLVGGVGIVVLFGILPSLISFKKTTRKPVKIFSVCMCLLFSLFLLLELGQEFGLLHLNPSVEHWTAPVSPDKHSF